jgi:hypothetical protein
MWLRYSLATIVGYVSFVSILALLARRYGSVDKHARGPDRTRQRHVRARWRVQGDHQHQSFRTARQ